jgi:hypothetical protein
MPRGRAMTERATDQLDAVLSSAEASVSPMTDIITST